MIPSANTVAREKAAHREQVVQAERVPGGVLQEVGEGCTFTPACDVRPQAVDEEAQEREEDLLLQLRDFEQVGDLGAVTGQLAIVPRPPARSSPGGGGDSHAFDGEAAPDVPIEQLESVDPPGAPARPNSVSASPRRCGELAQMADVHHLRGLLKGFVKPASGCAG